MKKKWYQSKTFYAGILIGIGVVGSYLNGTINTQELIMGVGGAVGLFGIRDAIK